MATREFSLATLTLNWIPITLSRVLFLAVEYIHSLGRTLLVRRVRMEGCIATVDDLQI